MAKGGAPLRARSLALGRMISCAIDDAGKVACWGTWPVWDAATGKFVSQPSGGAVHIEGFPDQVQAIVAGDDFVIALDSTGAAWSWGLNSAGTLGLGDLRGDITNERGAWVLKPQRVGGPDFPKIRQLLAGWTHVFAIDGNGVIWGWGELTYGAFGRPFDAEAGDRADCQSYLGRDTNPVVAKCNPTPSPLPGLPNSPPTARPAKWSDGRAALGDAGALPEAGSPP